MVDRKRGECRRALRGGHAGAGGRGAGARLAPGLLGAWRGRAPFHAGAPRGRHRPARDWGGGVVGLALRGARARLADRPPTSPASCSPRASSSPERSSPSCSSRAAQRTARLPSRRAAPVPCGRGAKSVMTCAPLTGRQRAHLDAVAARARWLARRRDGRAELGGAPARGAASTAPFH